MRSASCCAKQVIDRKDDSGKFERIKVLCDNSLTVRQTEGKLGNARVRFPGPIDHPRCAKAVKVLIAVHRFGKAQKAASTTSIITGRLPMPHYVH
jgi:hypothetical protein